jgi:hypothetical protein
MLKKLVVSAVVVALLTLPVTAFAAERVVGHSFAPGPTVSAE